jgi:Spy/CpxP family protein refolding chaperone
MNACNRWILSALVVALVTVVSVYAGGDRAEKLARMKTELNLTDAQVDQFDQKFDTLNPVIERAKALKTEIKELEAAPSPNQKAINAKKVELENVKREYHEKVTSIFRSVLTKEQFAKWEAQQAEYEKKAHSAKK